MCGILGFVRAKSTAATMDSDLAGVFTDGMLVGALRGMDSFGYMTCNDNNVRSIKKYAVAAPLLYGTSVFSEMLARAKASQIVVGHHRAKTTGVISEAAAHPYLAVSDDNKRVVWGVHNGSLTTWSTFQNGKNYITDSDYLFHMIANHGPEALRDINGAYAVAFMMSDQPGKLFLARNKDRPLSYAISANNKAFLFASEYNMMHWLTSRPQYSIPLNEELTAAKTAWADIQPHNLYTIDMADPANVVKEECLTPKPKIVAAAKSYSNTYDSYYGLPAEDVASNFKDKYPNSDNEEIAQALELDVLGKEVTGVITKLKYAKGNSAEIKYASGTITHDEADNVTGCRFHLRTPSKAWQEVIADANVNKIGIVFKIGGLDISKNHSEWTVVVGDIRYVFTIEEPDENGNETKQLVLVN